MTCGDFLVASACVVLAYVALLLAVNWWCNREG